MDRSGGYEIAGEVKAASWAAGILPALVICFAGNHEALAWEKRLRRLEVHFLHLQDSRGRWYLDGADGSAGFWDTLHKIKRFRATLPGFPVITIGQSSGGYAALRVGSILEADRIIAFAPQTRFVEPRQLYEGQHPIGIPRDLIDIRSAVNTASGEITLIVARSEAENPPSQFFFGDHAHLEGIERRSNVKVSVLDTHNHAVARDLAEAESLDGLILDEVSKAIKHRSAWSKLVSHRPNWWRLAAARRRGW